MTPDHGKPSLCTTCRSGMVIRGFAEGQTETHCMILATTVLWPVHECTKYQHRGALHLHDMERMATIIEIKRGVVGFRKLREDEL